MAGGDDAAAASACRLKAARAGFCCFRIRRGNTNRWKECDSAFSGKSVRGSAAHFGIGVATAIVWVRRARQTGERTAHKRGQPPHSKLDPHRDFCSELIEQTPDLTISELAGAAGGGRGGESGSLDIMDLPRPLRADV